ncbi:MAG: AraC family transcriptional regulator [Oscillospiraceae bacterium]|nr:AraC family transcriptional regulator [Oscillospiraceae bacterium]
MNDEFEIVPHYYIQDFRLFLVNLLYRTPHIHREFELNLILDGQVSLLSRNKITKLEKGDFFVVNPLCSHELSAVDPVMILSIQVSPVFFRFHYPKLERSAFTQTVFSHAEADVQQKALRANLLDLAHDYFVKEEGYELRCASLVNSIFYDLLHLSPVELLPEKDINAYQAKQRRIRDLTGYIDLHFNEKLLLSDLARQEGLSVCYLSRIFKEFIGISFQEYLMKIRCEKARYLLLLTDYSLLDISVSCGFSDPKYFNRGFQQQYGYTPKEYRRRFLRGNPPAKEKSLLTTQDFLSDELSLEMIEQCIRGSF